MSFPRIALVALALSAIRAAAQPTPEQLFAQRKYDDAQVAFTARLSADKNDATAMFYLGRIALERNRSGEAVDWFEKAIKRNEQSSEYHTWLGNALGTEAQKANKLRQPFLARRVKAEFERGVQLDPNNVDAHEGLYEFYSQAPGFMGGSMDKAREQVAEIIELSPTHGHRMAGRLAEKEKDTQTAEREFQAMLAAAPDSVAAATEIARFYQRNNQADRGFAAVDAFLQSHPDEVLARYEYGRLAALTGQNLERGEREMRAFIAQPVGGATAATIANARWRLGTILARQGKPEAARAEYREALRIDPKNANAKAALETIK